uniref:Transmembrane protein n=1 Tax=Davidia involucrata TaxID=16924 RepID=A0A5B7ATV2_DAVIN
MSQQPVLVYPNTVTSEPSSHPNGSFGTVFIVLAVIVVISAIACCLGRFFNRHYQHLKAKQNSQNHPSRPKGEARQNQPRQNHTSRPKGEARQNHTFDPKEGDIEFGFDKGIQIGKPVGNGNSRGHKPSENGEFKGERRFADDGESEAGA